MTETKAKGTTVTEKKQPLVDEELSQATGGGAMEYAQEDRIRHKYQCPKCDGTSFTRGIKSTIYWFPLRKKTSEWLECTTCGTHYPINGESPLIMLE